MSKEEDRKLAAAVSKVVPENTKQRPGKKAANKEIEDAVSHAFAKHIPGHELMKIQSNMDHIIMVEGCGMDVINGLYKRDGQFDSAYKFTKSTWFPRSNKHNEGEVVKLTLHRRTYLYKHE